MHVLPATALWAELPDLDLAVASASYKPSRSACLVSACADDLSGCDSGRPGYAVDATSMSLEELVCPVVVLKFEYRDVAVGRSASEKAARFVGCPGDEVDRGGVKGDLIYLLPAVGLLAPNEDLAVVRGRGEDVAVLGMRPCYAPDGALVSVKLLVGPRAACWAMTYPLSVSTSVCFSPSTSKILIVLSEEQVANRRP